MIADAPDGIDGFELAVRYEEPEATFSYNRLAHKFECALTKFGDGGSFAPARGYQNFLKIFLDGEAVDTTLPGECVPAQDDLLYDGFYENNRLRVGQSANPYRAYAFVVWYGQIIKLNSEIPFLLEVRGGSPVTPLAPTRTSLIDDRKLENLRRFVEDAVFAALADENAVGGAMRFLIAGDSEKLPLRKIYWKPGAAFKSIFVRARAFAVVSVSNAPVESDFHWVANQVFVFEYTGNFDIEEIEGLCVGLPMTNESGLLDEAVEWLGTFGKDCYSPDDDYDDDRQEEDFSDSISRLILELRGNVLSTNWSFMNLKRSSEELSRQEAAKIKITLKLKASSF